jgi:hypothetical protein
LNRLKVALMRRVFSDTDHSKDCLSTQMGIMKASITSIPG